jgi:putative endonuclease
MKRGGAVYIITNQWNSTLYTGVSSDIVKRIYQHKYKMHKGSFSAKYNLTKLVYFEVFHSIEEAIAREKQIKAGSRAKKIKLIESINPEWKDLESTIHAD